MTSPGAVSGARAGPGSGTPPVGSGTVPVQGTADGGVESSRSLTVLVRHRLDRLPTSAEQPSLSSEMMYMNPPMSTADMMKPMTPVTMPATARPVGRSRVRAEDTARAPRITAARPRMIPTGETTMARTPRVRATTASGPWFWDGPTTGATAGTPAGDVPTGTGVTPWDAPGVGAPATAGPQSPGRPAGAPPG